MWYDQDSHMAKKTALFVIILLILSLVMSFYFLAEGRDVLPLRLWHSNATGYEHKRLQLCPCRTDTSYCTPPSSFSAFCLLGRMGIETWLSKANKLITFCSWMVFAACCKLCWCWLQMFYTTYRSEGCNPLNIMLLTAEPERVTSQHHQLLARWLTKCCCCMAPKSLRPTSSSIVC